MIIKKINKIALIGLMIQNTIIFSMISNPNEKETQTEEILEENIRDRRCTICIEKLYQPNGDIHLYSCGHPFHGSHRECYKRYKRNFNGANIPCPSCRDIPEIQSSMDESQALLSNNQSEQSTTSRRKALCKVLANWLSYRGICKEVSCMSLYWHDCYPNCYNNCNDFPLLTEDSFRSRFSETYRNAADEQLYPNEYYRRAPESERENFNRGTFEDFCACPVMCFSYSLMHSLGCCFYRRSEDVDRCIPYLAIPCSAILYAPCWLLSAACPLTWWGTAYKCADDCSR